MPQHQDEASKNNGSIFLTNSNGSQMRWKEPKSPTYWLTVREILTMTDEGSFESSGIYSVEIQTPELHSFAALRLIRDPQKTSGSYDLRFDRSTRINESQDSWTLTFSPADFENATSEGFGGIEPTNHSTAETVSARLRHDGGTVITMRSRRRLKAARIVMPTWAKTFIQDKILRVHPETWTESMNRHPTNEESA